MRTCARMGLCVCECARACVCGGWGWGEGHPLILVMRFDYPLPFKGFVISGGDELVSNLICHNPLSRQSDVFCLPVFTVYSEFCLSTRG